VIVAVLAILGGAAWYFVLRSTPEKAVVAMLEAIADGDQEKLKAVLTDRSAEFAGMARGPMGMSDEKSEGVAYEVGEAEGSGDQVKVPVTYPISWGRSSANPRASRSTTPCITWTVSGRWICPTRSSR